MTSGRTTTDAGSAPERAAPRIRAVTPAEVDDYERRGWVHLPGLLDAGDAERLAQLAADMVATSSGVAPGRSQLASSFGVTARASEHDPTFAAVARSMVLGQNASRLLPGRPRVRLDGDNLLVKEPLLEGATHGPTRWHQDFAYQPMDRSLYVTFWFALRDVTAEMGSLRFVEGSQRLGLLGRSWQGDDGDLLVVHPWLADEPRSPALDLRPGDATAHSCLSVHGAPANRSSSTRLSYTCSYFDAATLFTGAPSAPTEGLGLRLNAPFDHPAYPLVAS